MTQTRSPRYPGLSLRDAIDLVKKLHAANRTNPTDRDAAAREMGFAGITGSSTKALADLAHFGLIDKAGKGGVRVSQRAIDILYPESPTGRVEALRAAAFSPALFERLHAHFQDGAPSDNALKSYLTRQGFMTAAIPLAVYSFLDTSRFLQEQNVSESDGIVGEDEGESSGSKHAGGNETTGAILETAPKPLSSPPRRTGEIAIVEGERVIFADEASPGQYLKLIASGAVDGALLDGLEDFTKRLKKRLGIATTTQPKEATNEQAALGDGSKPE